LREDGKEFVGTHTALWGITAGVYLALMGPHGMREVGEVIMHNCSYAEGRCAELHGVQVAFNSVHFKEFVVNFDQCGKSVAEINEALLQRGIFGGKDLSGTLPELGQSALYCVTERHTREDIDRLIEALSELLGGGGTAS